MNIGFIVWCATAALFFLLGVFCLFARNPVHFWANTRMFEVTDAAAYNKACAKLWIGYGTAFLICGLPMLDEQNAVGIILGSVVGTMFVTIALVITYATVIEKKYKKH